MAYLEHASIAFFKGLEHNNQKEWSHQPELLFSPVDASPSYQASTFIWAVAV